MIKSPESPKGNIKKLLDDYDEYMKTHAESVDTKDSVKSHETHSKITESLTQIQQKILEEISKIKYISQTDLAAQLSITRETINRNMKKLQNQGIIRRIGADKNGHWEILE